MSAVHRDLPSFPTRRSSDLDERAIDPEPHALVAVGVEGPGAVGGREDAAGPADAEGVGADALRRETGAPGEVHRPVDPDQDRKSTRLNSSHSSISYAVFCLK